MNDNLELQSGNETENIYFQLIQSTVYNVTN